MNWHDIWTYFGNFNDREFYRILVFTLFLFGIPVAVGLYARLLGWSVRQVRRCQNVIHGSTAFQPEEADYPVG